MVAAIRYLETFVKRDGVWLFSERKLMVDWTETRPSRLADPIAKHSSDRRYCRLRADNNSSADRRRAISARATAS